MLVCHVWDNVLTELVRRCRYDYEEIETGADKVMDTLRDLFADKSFVGSDLSATSSSTTFKVKEAGDFSYTDPIDHSVSKNQGLYIKFEDGSRIIFRLSGTGSQGATVRLYVEKYSKNPEEYPMETAKGLQPLIEVALKISRLEALTGRKEPTVVSVPRIRADSICAQRLTGPSFAKQIT